jgi:predicted  nucleic acid-binding Zn-ribbon protein
MPPGIIVPIAGMVTGLILLAPVVRTVVRIAEKKLAGRPEGEELAALRHEVRILHDRLDRLEDGDDRLAELEERLDFAERMLTQQRDAPRIEGGN